MQFQAKKIDSSSTLSTRPNPLDKQTSTQDRRGAKINSSLPNQKASFKIVEILAGHCDPGESNDKVYLKKSSKMRCLVKALNQMNQYEIVYLQIQDNTFCTVWSKVLPGQERMQVNAPQIRELDY